MGDAVDETSSEHPIMRPIRWLWAIGGAILAAAGIVLLVLFVVNSYEQWIAGIAGFIFAAVGIAAAAAGIHGIRLRRASRRS
jgi:protein-S-isoprenylcysteine O-methyltransferase Ste14